jgi:subtilase family serine protease
MKIFGRSGSFFALVFRAQASTLVLALGLTACGSGGGAISNALPSFSSSARSAADTTATPGNGALAFPGNGALAWPGNGALAWPGGNSIVTVSSSSLLGDVLGTLVGLLSQVLPVCGVTSLLVGEAQCNALLNPNVAVNPNPNLSPSQIYGYHPADLRSAYNVPSTGGSGKIVAAIVAGDDPTAENDLAVYRNAFGLAPCTSANGCFHKVNQSGATGSYPASLSGWPQEAGIDVEMISAVCPSCSILLVEANSAQISDLGAAVDTAVRMGAAAVSNSYYAREYDTELTDDVHYRHPGVPITVAAGDTGYGSTYPASSDYVISVGGTTLNRGLLGLGWSQSVWGGTGSGCSQYVSKPSWQTDSGCAMRTLNDVAVVADPMTGVAVYASTAPSGQAGWGVYGGTSVSAPIVAAMYALAGNDAGSTGASYAYAHPAAFKPVTSGNNGSCTPGYLCNGGFGYNGPAGLGTPSGLGGF